MNEIEKKLLVEVKRIFKAPIMEDVDWQTAAIIEPRAPDTKVLCKNCNKLTKQDQVTILDTGKDQHGMILTFVCPTCGTEQKSRSHTTAKDETFIDIYGFEKSVVRGERPPKGGCKLCGGTGAVTIKKSIEEHIKTLYKDMKEEQISPEDLSHKKTVLSKSRKIEMIAKDIQYLNDLLKKYEAEGSDKKLVQCNGPECKGWQWVDVTPYQVGGKYDINKARKVMMPWHMIVSWVYASLAHLNPQQGAVSPKEAGFENEKDKFGMNLEEGDVRRHIKLVINSIGTTNKEVFENLRKIFGKTSESLKYFRISAWPKAGIEDEFKLKSEVTLDQINTRLNAPREQGRERAAIEKVDIEAIEKRHRRFQEWIDQNRAFYIEGRIEDKRYGETTGLPKIDIPVGIDAKALIEIIRDELSQENFLGPTGGREKGRPAWSPKVAGLEEIDLGELAPWWMTPEQWAYRELDPLYVRSWVKKHYPEGMPEGMTIEELRKRLAYLFGAGEGGENLKADMPTLAGKPEAWQDIIRHVKGFSAQKRSARSVEAAKAFKQSEKYKERIKGREEEEEKAKTEKSYIERYPKAKYRYYDELIANIADAVGADAATAEVAVTKYMDTLTDDDGNPLFERPFDFDRLGVREAVSAIDIIDEIDPEELFGLAESVKRFINSILCEEFKYDEESDRIAKSIVADFGSQNTRKLYKLTREAKSGISNTGITIVSDNLFNSLLREAKPITKLMRVVPVLGYSTIFDPSNHDCWNNILHGNVADEKPTIIYNANKIREAFIIGMKKVQPMAIDGFKKMMYDNDRDLIAESITTMWDSIIGDRPILREKHQTIKKLIKKHGAFELNGSL